MRSFWWLWLLVGAGCEASDRTRAAAEIKGAAAEIKDAAAAEIKDAAAAARGWAAGLRLGELSESARGWLRAGAAASSAGIEAVLEKGEQVVPVAQEIGRSVGKAVDVDTAIEPIYQELSGGEGDPRRAAVDAAIQAMPRVEVIDGLQVGFKQVSSLDAGRQSSESAYLVTWRQGDRLVGFVYRSRRSLDLQELVAAAPRLVGLVRSAL